MEEDRESCLAAILARGLKRVRQCAVLPGKTDSQDINNIQSPVADPIGDQTTAAKSATNENEGGES